MHAKFLKHFSGIHSNVGRFGRVGPVRSSIFIILYIHAKTAEEREMSES